MGFALVDVGCGVRKNHQGELNAEVSVMSGQCHILMSYFDGWQWPANVGSEFITSSVDQL